MFSVYLGKNTIAVKKNNYFIVNKTHYGLCFQSRYSLINHKVQSALFSYTDRTAFKNVNIRNFFLKKNKTSSKKTLCKGDAKFNPNIYFKTANNCIGVVRYNKLNLINLEFILFSNYNFTSKLEIVGYIRRAWYSKLFKQLLLRVGYSHYNLVLNTNTVFLKLIKKRIILLFSNSKVLLNNVYYNTLKTKPSDSYKIAGIIPYKFRRKLKKSKKQKAGSKR